MSNEEKDTIPMVIMPPDKGGKEVQGTCEWLYRCNKCGKEKFISVMTETQCWCRGRRKYMGVYRKYYSVFVPQRGEPHE